MKSEGFDFTVIVVNGVAEVKLHNPQIRGRVMDYDAPDYEPVNPEGWPADEDGAQYALQIIDKVDES